MTEETYICVTCNSKQVLEINKQVICNSCHNRIFRKPRLDNVVQYKAR